MKDITIRFIPFEQLINKDNIIFGIVSSKSADSYYEDIMIPLLGFSPSFKDPKIGTRTNNVTGIYNTLNGNTYVFENSKLSQTIVHEKYSHGTDYLIQDVEFYPSNNWKEGRATMNELRKLLYDAGFNSLQKIRHCINTLTDIDLLTLVRSINSYGKRMSLYDIDFLRYSLIYLP